MLRVVGEDAGIGTDAATKKRSHADFVLRVESVNDAPVASPLKDQKVAEDSSGSHRFKAFTDEETPSSGLVYSAHLLVFPSPSGGEVLFEDSHAGVHTLRVVGEDAGIGTEAATKKRSHADFVLRVESVNDAPVASPLKDQKVAEDSSGSHRFKAFTDEETSSSGLVYSAHLLVFPSSSGGEVLFEDSHAGVHTLRVRRGRTQGLASGSHRWRRGRRSVRMRISCCGWSP